MGGRILYSHIIMIMLLILVLVTHPENEVENEKQVLDAFHSPFYTHG